MGRVRVWSAVAAMVVVGAGCGGGDDDGGFPFGADADGEAPDDLGDLQLDEDAEEMIDALTPGADVDIDEDGGMQIETGNDEQGATMGDDLERPEWLPGDFPLPEGMAIGLVGHEQQDDLRFLVGSPVGDVAGYASEVEGWLTANGYDVYRPGIEENGQGLSAVHPDGTVVDIDSFVGQVEVRFSKRDVATEVAYTDTPGVLEVTIGGETIELEGTCSVHGPEYGWQTEQAADGTWNDFYLYPEEPASGGVSLYLDDGEYRMNLPSYSDVETQYSHDGDSQATMSGMFQLSGGAEPVEGSVSLTCE